MQSLDQRLKDLEAQAQATTKPGGAGRIHAWLTAHGIETPPPDHPDMLLADYLVSIPTAALKEVLRIHKAKTAA